MLAESNYAGVIVAADGTVTAPQILHLIASRPIISLAFLVFCDCRATEEDVRWRFTSASLPTPWIVTDGQPILQAVQTSGLKTNT